MKVTLQDIQQRFDALIEGTESREDVAEFAGLAMRADDARSLEIEYKFEDRIWKAILFLSGVDLQYEPGRYLYSVVDFIKTRKNLEI